MKERKINMPWDGFLQEGSKCEQCGKILNEDGQYPAELYAGTYCGLCDQCMCQGIYQVKGNSDGSKLMSHPPHCPSWRRDREEYIWFEDCDLCNKGAVKIDRSFAYGGTYNVQCKKCSERHYGALQ